MTHFKPLSRRIKDPLSLSGPEHRALVAAVRAVWAGQVLNTHPGGHHTVTQMGNGIFPKEKQTAAYFHNLQVLVDSGQWAFPPGLNNFNDNRFCYDSEATFLFCEKCLPLWRTR
ncbi:hypothetical protein AMTR_s00016p00042380 [Amborella trichopoda]|uniref:Neprosin PEP catalytic domain-containing protein n=1 Tax=Amborella trichopoda TaxID=13333 RepID=W1PEN7_AMBTC|nr:hypothetical protein AMTR_s00016p00042380 [Amborella trichopoda]